MIVDLLIEDITFSADGPLNCSEASVPALCESLYNIEVALLKRLEISLQLRPKETTSLFLLFLDAKDDPGKLNPAASIANWQVAVGLVTERRGFRPAVAKGSCATAHLIRLCGKTTPEHLQKTGKIIGEALSCSSAQEGSIVSVMYRSTWPETSSHSRFARNLLVTLYAAYQYITASAHSDQYPKYPIPLIYTLSQHLIGQLDELSEVLLT